MTPNHTYAKAKLFALYYDQWFFDEDGNMLRVNRGYTLSDMIYGKSYLQLRSIADLTDEEKEYLILLYRGQECFDYYLIQPASLKQHKRDTTAYEIREYKQYWIDHLKAIDYLRSIGIALPFTVLEDGKPRTYSVEEQCELNWIQLNHSK